MINDKIAETLDIQPYVEPINVPVVSADTEDFDYARQNLHQVIETGKIAMNKALYLAAEAESPRAFEVLATLLKTVADTSEQLLELQKKQKDITSEVPKAASQQSPQSVTNVAIVTGTLQDVDKLAQKLIQNSSQSKVIDN